MANIQVTPQVAALAATLKSQLESLPTSRELTDEEAEALYCGIYPLAMQGRYEEARARFTLLITFKPTNLKYLGALALTHRHLGRHEDAVSLYRLMDGLDPGNPEYTLAMAECRLHLRQQEQATKLLNDVVEFCESWGLAGPVLDRARALRDLTQPRGDHAARH